VGGGVQGRCRGPGQHADDAADDGAQDRLARNCVRIWAFVAPRATEADLRAAFQH
jgi:hypothetical protein